MSTPEIRPSFERHVALQPHALLQRFKAAAGEPSAPFVVEFRGNHVQVAVPESTAHLWSPWLTLEVDPDESGSFVHGRYSSNPTFFTAYAATLAAVTLSAVGLGVFGIAQWSLGQSAWALWAWPVGAVLDGLLLLVPFAGQTLAREQLTSMHGFVEALLETSD